MVIDNVIFLSYGLPCLITYIIVLVSISTLRKELSSGFVALFMLDAVVNLLTYFNTWITLRLRSETWFAPLYHAFNDSIFIPYLQNFLTGYFYYGQNLASFLLSLDRFVAISCT
ncbi:hypothetical protein PFISCL1PPCAC_12665, partial [Pristionchus fissidentatus]